MPGKAHALTTTDVLHRQMPASHRNLGFTVMQVAAFEWSIQHGTTG